MVLATGSLLLMAGQEAGVAKDQERTMGLLPRSERASAVGATGFADVVAVKP